MVNYVFLFKVQGSLSYLSHLELMKVFRQALRRSSVPVAYSEGFNPHMKLSFAVAKGVGLPSVGELLEITVIKELDLEQTLETINKNLPVGLEVLVIKKRTETKKSLTALLKRGSYDLSLEGGTRSKEAIKDFFAQESISLMVKSKRVFKEKDIRPFILDWEIVKESESALTIQVVLAQGSEANLRVDVLKEALVNFLGFKGEVEILRRGLYGVKDLLIEEIV